MKGKLLTSVLTVVVVLLSCLSFGSLSAFAENVNVATVSVVGQSTTPNSVIQVELKISNNPGISGAKLTLSYDSKLTLTDSASNGVFSNLYYTKPGVYTSPCNFNWDSENTIATEDGTFLTLSFAVSADAQPNDVLPISITYRQGDVYDDELNSVDLIVENSVINIIDYIPGDVNYDNIVNGKDVTLIRRFNAGGYGVSINEHAADVNNDNVINGKDVTLIRRFLAGGYGVELSHHTGGCIHKMTTVKAVPASCTEDGNIEYWHCEICDKYFSDEDGQNEITLEDTVVNANGHTYSDVWSCDNDCHWHDPNCAHKDDENIELKDLSEHTYIDHKCSVCSHIEEFVVTFYDYDDTVLDIQMVAYGNGANEPEIPKKTGYTFIGWDTDFSSVNSNIIVTAQYEIVENQVSIKYTDNGNGTTTALFSIGGDVDIAMIELRLYFELTNATYSKYDILATDSADANYDDLFIFSFYTTEDDLTEPTDLFSITFVNGSGNIGIQFNVIDSSVSDGSFTNVKPVTIVGTTYNG